jgi:hypothetical protein
MPVAIRLPERDVLFEASAAQYLRDTHSPETLKGVVWSKPPDGAIPVLVRDILLLREKRPDSEAAPCPICCPRTPKYLRGALAWFPEEGVYRCIGIECIARLCGEESAYHVRRNFDKKKALDADFTFAFDKIALAPLMRAYLEALLPAAEHVEKLRRDIGRSQVRKNLWGVLSKNDGQLVVWDEREIDRIDARTGRTFTRLERIPTSFGHVTGQSALVDNFSVSKELRVVIGRLSVFCIDDAEGRVVDAYHDHQSLRLVRKVLYLAKRLKEDSERKVVDVLEFFSEANFQRIQKFGHDPRSEFPVFAVARDGEFRIGTLRSDVIKIRPNFGVMQNLPAWPDLE